jgi:hypothetical protein
VIVSLAGLQGLRRVEMPWASVAAGEVIEGGSAVRLPPLSGIVLTDD